MRFIEVVRSMDWVLTTAALLLVMLSLAMLVSSTYTEELISPLFIRQTTTALIGFGAFFLMAKVPYHFWRRYWFILYGLGMAGLLIVATYGVAIQGAVRRISIMGFQFQPSEFMRVALVVALAWLLSRYEHIRWKQICISGLLIIVPVLLIIREPDFGVASLILAVWASMLVFLGLSWRITVALMLIGVLAAGGAWQWHMHDYQKERVMTFLNPTADPLRSGYNVTQAIIALGSGQVMGRGLGHGPQSQLKFLPERHTDFMFASIGEELGFIGVTVVVLLYAIVLWRLLLVTRLTQDVFGKLLSAGTFILLFFSFTISAGMNMGILPVTGIPMPLVSFGGSSLVSTLILLGLVQSVRIYSRFVQPPPQEISGFN
jgi:rod shape determining protein RodA